MGGLCAVLAALLERTLAPAEAEEGDEGEAAAGWSSDLAATLLGKVGAHPFLPFLKVHLVSRAPCIMLVAHSTARLPPTHTPSDQSPVTRVLFARQAETPR